MAQIFPNDSTQNIIDSIVKNAAAALISTTKDIHKNKVDPFSAVIDSMIQGLTISEWIKLETARQNQKTLQNEVGRLHQRIIGSFTGWQDLGVGGVVDVVCNEKKILAEIKNKFNTTKGNHKTAIYNDLRACLKKPNYKDYIGYYVEIIPSGGLGKRVYNIPFTPSDNVLGQRVQLDENIRKIDGVSFYEKVTGQANALHQLYAALPGMVRNSLGRQDLKPENDSLFNELFEKAFHKIGN